MTSLHGLHLQMIFKIKDSVLLHFQRIIGSQPLIDTDGVLLVGAKAPSTERFIGYLQDVRIYTARLQDR